MPEPEIEAILANPAIHSFTKVILSMSLVHDPVDALGDVEIAMRVLKARLDRIFTAELSPAIKVDYEDYYTYA